MSALSLSIQKQILSKAWKVEVFWSVVLCMVRSLGKLTRVQVVRLHVCGKKNKRLDEAGYSESVVKALQCCSFDVANVR